MKFVRKIAFKDKIIVINLQIIDTKNIQLGLNSGEPFRGSHFLLLDYDEKYPEEFNDILLFNNLKRGLIVESSPLHYHALSFSPLLFPRMLQIMKDCNCDRNQYALTEKNGFSTLRFTPKKDFQIKVVQEIENKEGVNFYSYYHEDLYKNKLIIYGGI